MEKDNYNNNVNNKSFLIFYKKKNFNIIIYNNIFTIDIISHKQSLQIE